MRRISDIEISNAPSISVHFSDTDGAFIKSSFIFVSTVYIGKIIKGIKLYTIPSSTAPSLYKNEIDEKPNEFKMLFTIPFLPSIGSHAYVLN